MQASGAHSCWWSSWGEKKRRDKESASRKQSPMERNKRDSKSLFFSCWGLSPAGLQQGLLQSGDCAFSQIHTFFCFQQSWPQADPYSQVMLFSSSPNRAGFLPSIFTFLFIQAWQQGACLSLKTECGCYLQIAAGTAWACALAHTCTCRATELAIEGCHGILLFDDFL